MPLRFVQSCSRTGLHQSVRERTAPRRRKAGCAGQQFAAKAHLVDHHAMTDCARKLRTMRTRPTTQGIRNMRKIARLLGAGVLVWTLGSHPMLHAANAGLLSPMASADTRSRWPVELGVSLVRVGTDPDGCGEAIVEPSREDSSCHAWTLVVPDGQRISLSRSLVGARGIHRFDLTFVARQHPRSIEVEWDLLRYEAPYETVSWSTYLMHRLHLGPQLSTASRALTEARSDIAEVVETPLRVPVIVDGEAWELLVKARSMRG